MINNDNIVLIMNEDTYEAVKKETFKNAEKKPDPIDYILKFNSIEIITDNEVEFGVTEVWDKKDYQKYQEYKRGE